jgi:hypothetical protein
VVNGEFRPDKLLNNANELILRRVERRCREILIGRLIGMLQDARDSASDLMQVARLEFLVARINNIGRLILDVDAERPDAQSLSRVSSHPSIDNSTTQLRTQSKNKPVDSPVHVNDGFSFAFSSK